MSAPDAPVEGTADTDTTNHSAEPSSTDSIQPVSTLTGHSADSMENGEYSVRSAIEKAFEQVPESTEDPDSDNGQAAGDTGDSTRTDEFSADSASDNGGANGLDSGDSTLTSEKSTEAKPTLPDNWPQEHKDTFSKLSSEGQDLVLNIYRDMDTGLQKKFQELAGERKRLQDSFGLEPQQIHDLAEKARQYQKDPVSLITNLADQAGVKIYFSQPDQGMPEFESQEDMAKWLLEKADEKARQTASDQLRTTRLEQEKAASTDRLKQEILQVAQKYPDFANHRENIFKILSCNNGVSPEQAYRLATWDNLMAMAKDHSDKGKKLEQLQKDLETLKKQSTMPVAGTGDRSRQKDLNGMDVYETAFSRAKRNRSQA